MIYTQLYQQSSPDSPIQVGVIGTGHFATATITQAQAIARMDVPIVADIDVDAAKRAYAAAGIQEEDIIVASGRASALYGLERKKWVIVTDALLLMDLPLDIIVEATGDPEAGALHAQQAIRNGKHVAMVNKETDATVGSLLAQLASEEGVIYTPVDGDQHGLLISMVLWAEELGLEILCGGKARDSEFVYNPEMETVGTQRQTVQIDETDLFWLQPLDPAEMARHLHMRHNVLSPLPQVGGFDLVEMAIVANATGLLPDHPLVTKSAAQNESYRLGTDARLTNRGSAEEEKRISSAIAAQSAGRLHCPALHTSEIPQVLCPQEYGGILSSQRIIDCVTSLHLPHEAGLGGGVFVVVGCDNDYSRQILTRKGCLSNKDESTALIYRPYHLCGVETPISLLNAALLGQSTLAELPRPLVDVVARTTRDFSAGETIGTDHSPDLEFLMNLAEPVVDDAPIPIHMANGNRLVVDVPAGAILTSQMIEPPDDSVLWALRKQQDKILLG